MFLKPFTLYETLIMLPFQDGRKENQSSVKGYQNRLLPIKNISEPLFSIIQMKFFINHQYKYYCVIFITLMICSFGCNKKSLPPDLPGLYAVSCVVTQENQPLENASVGLISVNPDMKWSATARTDSNGKAVFYTNGQYEGVAAGKYKVVISKTERGSGEPIPPKPTNIDEIIQWQHKYIDHPAPVPNYQIVESVYGEPTTTPFEIEVVAEKTSEKNVFSFDVGKAIRKEIKRLP
jgi:5-hydroxyisourate hydrolase-like protein (transthyretin family)